MTAKNKSYTNFAAAKPGDGRSTNGSKGRRRAHEKLCFEIVRCALAWNNAHSREQLDRAIPVLRQACDALDKFETEGNPYPKKKGT